MGRKWIVVAVVASVVGLLIMLTPAVWVLYSCLRLVTDSDGAGTCSHNMFRLGLALGSYEMDHGRFPRSDAWVDSIYPYVKDWSVFRCPADRSKGRCSYAMNDTLSEKALSSIERPSEIVLLYEPAHAGQNPHGTGADLPKRGRHPYPRFGATATYQWFILANGDRGYREWDGAAPQWRLRFR